MADNPGKKASSSGENIWRTPDRPARRTEFRTAESERQQIPTWRSARVVVTDEEAPRAAPLRVNQLGEWHLPRPEDTSLLPPPEAETVEDLIPPDDSLPVAVETEAEADELAIEPVLPHDEVAPAEAETVAEVLPFDDGQQGDTLEELAAELGSVDAEAVAEAADEALGETLEEEEPDTYSMSELIALANLVGDAPGAAATTPPAVTDTSAGEATGGEAAADPAAYAREQLSRFQSGAAEAEAVDDEASVASGVTMPSAAVDVSAAEPLSPAEQQLLSQFREKEQIIHELRDQFRAGAMTREQFQASLRNHMVLDPSDNTYWMLGVESDQWYHYVDGTWKIEVPPVMAKAARAPSTPAPSTGAPTGYDMPLPARVPVRDPEATIPGTEAVFIGGSTEATVPMTAVDDPNATIPNVTYTEVTVPGATIPNPAVAVPSGTGIPAPIPTEDPTKAPDYDLSRPSPEYELARQRAQRKTATTIAIAAAVLIGAVLLFGACGIISGVLYYRNLAAPFEAQIAGLANYQPQFRTARILAVDGSLIAELIAPNSGARETISLAEISPYLIHAVISVENERYYDDPGWDPIAISRALIQNFTSGQIESGASTITQQIARNLILQDTTVSAQRKLEEIVIASEIAQRYDKNFILELYLNEVFFGNQSYGIEAASQFYFGHSAADLDIAEAALLAGLIQAPALYDPLINRDAAFDRMNYVLERMAATGCIQFQHAPYLGQPFCVSPSDLTSGQTILSKAQVEARQYTPRSFTVRYPHFVNYIQAQIEQTFGTSEMYRRGFEIRTTLNPRIQNAAQNALSTQVQAASVRGVNTGAVLVTNPADGSILAMIGSPDFNNNQIDGQVNNVFTWQQPGSSIKIVEYTAALEGVERNGVIEYMTPATILWDVPTTWNTIPPYTPVNYDGRFHGAIPLRYALGNSYNIPAVKVYEFIGQDRFLDTAGRLGLRFLENAQFGLATALGATEVRLYDHVQAYGTIANNGIRVPLNAIIEIRDAAGANVELPPRAQPTQTIQPQVAYLMQSILSDNNARADAFGLNSGMFLPEYAGLIGAKTGTTNDNIDLWTMGFSRNVVVGVWMGRHDNGRTSADTSITAIPVWNAVMRAALEGSRPQAFQPPQGIAQAQICADTGTLFDPAINSACRNVRTEFFIQNAPPPAADQGFVQYNVQIDSWTGLRANQFCPDNIVTTTGVNISDPTAIAWLNSPAGQGFAAALGLPVPVPSTTTAECQINQPLPQASIASPQNGQVIQGNFTIQGMISAQNFNRYQIEIAPVNTSNFSIIAGPFGQQVPAGGTLATWDTINTPNGAYTLRLAAFANDGGYLYRTVQVQVNNPLPTATPTIPPVPTAFPTPLPFDTPIPFDPGGQAAPGPTPTIFLGG
ncbi:hypothetical protein FBR02_09195 [Anaerolineae bacterium CFX9]|nr:hypothetical protein [Anaerolineae bacterium CFX9]